MNAQIRWITCSNLECGAFLTIFETSHGYEYCEKCARDKITSEVK